MGVKLQSGQTVFIDTAPLIYFMEENTRYIEGLTGFFNAVTRLELCLSPLMNSNLTCSLKTVKTILCFQSKEAVNSGTGP